jgi:Coenzyme PQQ synthesis protein D (PqqD)
MERAMRRADHVIWEVTGARAVLLDPDGTELITLNPVGTLVWDAIDGRPPDAIAELLYPQFEGVTREQLAIDVRAFLGDLEALGVIVPADE